MAKDVRNVVAPSRSLLTDTLDGFESGRVRVSTVRDIFRAHLQAVAEARGEQLGTLAE